MDLTLVGYWLVATILLLFGLPILVYLIVRMATFGYYMGRYQFTKFRRENKDHERQS